MADLAPDESMDVALFIEEIKMFPAIWNPNSEEYHDRAKKKDAWDRICRMFSDGNEVGSSANRIKLIKKWCSLKDYYLKKKLKQVNSPDSGKEYVYASQLSFLSGLLSDDTVTSSKTDNSPSTKKQASQSKTRNSKNVAFDVDFPLSIEELVEEVEKYPQIWNVSADGYHEKYRKKAAWDNVCRKFFPRYDDVSEQDKSYVYHRLINKWRNVKDNYIKSIKKKAKTGTPSEEGRPYIYAHNLSFLHQPRGPIEIQPIVKCEEFDYTSDQDNYDTYEQETITEYDVSVNEESVSDQGAKRKHESTSTVETYVSTVPVSCSTLLSRSDFNADRMFFESLLPSISDFSEDQKLEFRSEILQVVKKFRRQ